MVTYNAMPIAIISLPMTELFSLSCVLGHQVITTPLPSGGPVLVSMLNILEGFNFTDKDQGKSLTYHYILEVIKIELDSTLK